MIRYNISIPQPSSHFIHIEMHLDKITKPKLQLFLPSWRPGRYELGNFSKNVRGWKVYDEKGKELSFKKITKDCWEINTGKSKSIVVKYHYFANILNAGACWLDEEQLYINGIHCFMYDDNRMEENCEVQLDIPASWKIACGLKEKKHVLASANFHELVDSPFIASAGLKHGAYEVNKIKFNIWLQGECKPDWERIISDFKTFTEEQLALFKTFPAKDYHFLIQVMPYAYYHGVEHTNSTVLALGPGYDLMKPELYHELLGVACHELFHVWNIKTIRPADMLPYNYQQENYSSLGYIYEGVTTYYGDYLLGRCGIYTDQQFLAEMSKRFQSHMDNAGRFNYSVAQSSFDTWLDGYVPGIAGRKTSIYDEGCVLAMILDLMIRKDTNGKKSLDDLMRLLEKNFGQLKKGYAENDLVEMLKQISGKSYQSFFDNYINKPVSYDHELAKQLQHAGCEIIKTHPPNYFEHHFGFKISADKNTTRILKIYPGSVAHDSGLFDEDELISINRYKIENNLEHWCRYFENETIILKVFTNKSERTIKLKPGKEKYYQRYSIVRSKKITKEQERFFEGWLGR